MPKKILSPDEKRRTLLLSLLSDNQTAWEGEEDSVKEDHPDLLEGLGNYSTRWGTPALEELLRDCQNAWESEEASVKAEHEELIERNIEALDGIPARKQTDLSAIKPGAEFWWRDPDNGMCSQVGTVLEFDGGNEVVLRGEGGCEFGACPNELFLPAVQPRA